MYFDAVARQRADLLADKIKIPTSIGTYETIDQWLPCQQPDEIEDGVNHDGFNVVIYDLDHKEKFRVMSIDLDFSDHMPLRYTKLWSLNPDEYRIITEDEAYKGYTDWLKHFVDTGKTMRNAKSFAEWLDTEI